MGSGHLKTRSSSAYRSLTKVVSGGSARVARDMAPDRGNGGADGVAHRGRLGARRPRPEREGTGRTRHDDGFRRYGFERQVEVAPVTPVAGDVGLLPSLQHGKQVVGIAVLKQRVPEAFKEVVSRSKAHRFDVDLFAIEGLREGPAGVDASERLQSRNRLWRDTRRR